MERFSCKTEIISGPGAVSELGKLGAKRLLLVTDPYFSKNGTADRVLSASGAEESKIFDKVTPDPAVELAAEGTALIREFHPDFLVALGGGSAMDCAKAMVYFSGEKCRFAAIPTTSGSGSEVTDFAILTHDQIKHPLVDQRLRPDYAILDSDLLKELPPSLVADGGFDVLTHALEAFAARNADMFTDALAKEAFCTVFKKLSESYAGCRQVRIDIHRGATMAGLAFTQAGLGICHAMSHVLGGLFHVPHGRLNAILLPAVLDANGPAVMKKYAEIARAAGLSGSADLVAVRNLKSGLISLRHQLGLPDSLSQAGVDPQKIAAETENIIRGTLEDPCCLTNPITPDGPMVRNILEAVTNHG